ncbi:MAG: precorrin-6y C5,15-methyltransferase (decarboxylating) subunit CbiE, partial [Clostridiales bacterium]|nr:precorrin-6y C5,15-methyltransferase (decarboxylating) subunit CbiE [Clostridiales bacterium]
SYYRLLRGESAPEATDGAQMFDDAASAAAWLNMREGNIFLTTGLKELPVFAETMTDKGRLYIRTLLQTEVFDQMKKYGLSAKQFLCMQGPFSKEMNLAVLRMTGAKYLVTKESGDAGGFYEKTEAAKACGAVCVVIRRPVREKGYSAAKIREIILKLREDCQPKSEYEGNDRSRDGTEKRGSDLRRVTLVGIGMGATENMTVEVQNACREADCIIGADRMLDALKAFRKPTASLYLGDEIADHIRRHPEYRNIVIAFSGDVGFYSGAKKILEKLEKNTDDTASDMEIRLLCGVSTPAYFASRLKMSWEDMVLMSTHGRDQNLIGAVRGNPKVFTLASDAKSISAIAEKLVLFGLGDSRMYVGADLSYPTEAIYEGRAEEFVRFERSGMLSGEKTRPTADEEYARPDCPGLYAAVICSERAKNKIVTHGIPDEAFNRGKVPMTKEEVRSVSVSKLRLTRDAVVYDIGSGTGSIAVECARAADRGRVFAVEWNEDAWKLIAENRRKFAVPNLEIVPGRAPEILSGLPAPTHAFIGGSGGSMKMILKALFRKNPSVRVVINCITLETVNEILEAAREQRFEIEDITAVSITKSRPTGEYHMMTAQNPVTVITVVDQRQTF